jgi:chemotaxis protein CheX
LTNESFIADIIDVTKEVLSTMADFEAEAQNVEHIAHDANEVDVTDCFDITSVLGFSGGRKGSILISLTQEAAFRAVGGMLGIEIDTLNNDVTDGVGELVNMIAGGAKTRFQNRGVEFDLSIPNTVIGMSHQISVSVAMLRSRIDFTSRYGRFFMEVFIKEDLAKQIHQASETVNIVEN